MVDWQTTAMIRIDLSVDEISLLQGYQGTSPIKLIRNKAQAILLRSQKVPLGTIAFTQNVSYRTVQRWLKDFDTRRLASIFSGLVGNEHAAKLTREQKEELQKVLKQKPSANGIPKEFWEVPELKEYISARYGAVYESDRSYHLLLEFSNLSFKYPDTFDVRRNEQKIAARMEAIYEELLPLMDDGDWEIFASDEVCLRLEAITRRAWLQKGKRTVLRVARESTKQNYLGFLNQRDFTCQVFEIATGNLEEVIRATTELVKKYSNKKIAIVWDNATCHKGKLMQQALTKGGALERVHLINLPPYAPDYNPIEKVWNAVKQLLANKQNSVFAETKKKFVQLVSTNNFYFQL